MLGDAAVRGDPPEAVSTRTDLLYVSPVIPALTGNGLAMRAGAVLRALALRYRVCLLVVPFYSSWTAEIPAELAAVCEATALVQRPERTPGRFLPLSLRVLRRSHRQANAAGNLATWVDVAAGAFHGRRFDVVHHFRLATLPFGEPYLQTRRRPASRRHLDLDDVESIARQRLATLYRLHGREAEAVLEEQAATRCRRQEDATLRDFDRVYVCSDLDRKELLPRATAELRVLANAVAQPPARPPWVRRDPFTFLFIGTLGYFPNEDAVLYFCRECLPLLRASAPCPVRFQIAGTGATPALLAGARQAGADVAGPVNEIPPLYERACASVIPLRAGGGTRIKALEAFAYGRPVVSTSIGVEGIEAADGEHLLLADSAAAFAAACVRLIVEPGLADRLAAKAFALVRERYTVEAMAEAVEETNAEGARNGPGIRSFSR